jgi:hypothetical protein
MRKGAFADLPLSVREKRLLDLPLGGAGVGCGLRRQHGLTYADTRHLALARGREKTFESGLESGDRIEKNPSFQVKRWIPIDAREEVPARQVRGPTDGNSPRQPKLSLWVNL